MDKMTKRLSTFIYLMIIMVLVSQFNILYNNKEEPFNSPDIRLTTVESVSDSINSYQVNEVERLNSISRGEYYRIDFENMDLSTRSYLTANEINLMLSGTGLSGLGNSFIKAEQEYNVNALFLISLCALESGWGKSQLSINKNNITGYCAYDNNTECAIKFQYKEDCILRTAKLMSNDYLDKQGIYYKGNTVSAVNIYYASDKKWDDKILSIMKDLKKGHEAPNC